MGTPVQPRLALALLGATLLVAPAVLAAPVANPTPATHWLSLINTTHAHPTGMTVIVVPPGYLSKEAQVDNRDWIGPNALYANPSVQATLEAIAYWQWMIDAAEARHPHLAKLTFTARVLGVDATPDDLSDAEIIVNTGMATDPLPYAFHLGIGTPTYPVDAVLFSDTAQTVCSVWNTGVGQEATDTNPVRLRNLVLHEFGHCLGAGHTGTSLSLSHCDSQERCFDSHPTDVMSRVRGDTRQCLSNLNVESLAEGYAWLATPGGTWQSHDGELHQAKTQYTVTCMPVELRRF